MTAPRGLCILAALFSLPASSCARRVASRPLTVAPAEKVCVQLESIMRHHPLRAVFGWKHSPFRVDAGVDRHLDPLYAGRFELSSTGEGPIPSPESGGLSLDTRRARQQERAAIDDLFRRVPDGSSRATVYVEEEEQLALQDEIEKMREEVRLQFKARTEDAREKAAADMARIRLDALRVRALETQAAAARRKAASDEAIRRRREQLMDTTRHLEEAMQKEIAAKERQVREKLAREKLTRDAPAASRPSRADIDRDRELLHRSLSADLESPAPQTMTLRRAPLQPATTADAESPAEPTLRPRLPGASADPPIDRAAVDRWVRAETEALIRQWAKLERVELVSLQKKQGMPDRTDACLAWLSGGVWRKPQ